jgi:hypothetical protein
MSTHGAERAHAGPGRVVILQGRDANGAAGGGAGLRGRQARAGLKAGGRACESG